jgi:hypothetical protein
VPALIRGGARTTLREGALPHPETSPLPICKNLADVVSPALVMLMGDLDTQSSVTYDRL